MLHAFLSRARAAPHLRALAAATTLAALLGCGPSTSLHHVQSARARTVAPTIAPPLNPSIGPMQAFAGIRVSRAFAGEGTVRTPNVGEPGDVEAYRAYPGNYELRREPLTLGLEYQVAFLPQFDIFLAAEGTPSSARRASVLAGAGLTLPIPWLHVRFAPAFGGHTYRMAVVDSISMRTGFFHAEHDSIHVDRRDGHGLGMLTALSVSAWIPRAFTGLPVAPFGQFQWGGVNMSSRTLPHEVLGVQAWSVGGGADVETEWGHVRARVLREALGERGYHAYYRADVGLHARLPTPREARRPRR